ncbi:hypothetical protein BGZ65_012406 [Modicella reniformis]|uniref:Uncharacterized protein n=1 Tax=Modicella reniformis TaxID=1440133 RepID=A0A9P6SUJ3_9FUNG|nr:hypothetical protein BGZ65_012406 [Modicella reniformis]
MSDESDCERSLGQGLEAPQTEDNFSSSATVATVPVPPWGKQYEREQGRRRSQIPSESPLSHHLFLTPVLPLSRTPPHSPFQHRKQASFSMNTPPSSASSVYPAPYSDAAAVDALVREHVRVNMLTHSTDTAFFWHLGKLSEFSFSDRFVRSRVFEIKKNTAEADSNTTEEKTLSETTEGTEATRPPANPQGTSSWRLRLYPVRPRYLLDPSDGARLSLNRRSSAVITEASVAPFSSSVPTTSFMTRGFISSSPRRSISGASSLPMVKRHVTLFIATENGDCLAKQDLIEWFSGSEGGLGFPRIVSRKTVLDAVKSSSMTNDDEESELGIVAGVIFHGSVVDSKN